MASDLPYYHLGGSRSRSTVPGNFMLPPVLSSSNISAPHESSPNHSRSHSGPVLKNTSEPPPNISRTRSRRTITLGKPLPVFLKTSIQFLLGINPNTSRRTSVGKAFYIMTIAFAVGFFITSLVFIHNDIIADFTKTTVMDGTVGCIFVILWCAVGIYNNGLGYRLFSDDHLRPLIRMPTKTIFGMNSALLLLLLLFFAIFTNDYSGKWMLESKACNRYWLSVVGCKLRYVLRVSFSVFAFTWHYLVMFMVISICRSFTISIRQLMQSLERDGRAYEWQYTGVHGEDDKLLREYAWVDPDYCQQLQEEEQQQAVVPAADAAASSRSSSWTNLVHTENTDTLAVSDAEAGAVSPAIGHGQTIPSSGPAIGEQISISNNSSAIGPRHPVTGEETIISISPNHNSEQHISRLSGVIAPQDQAASIQILTSDNTNLGRQSTSSASKGSSGKSSTVLDKVPRDGGNVPLMSNAEILYQIWKIQTGLRMFGLATQRWLLSILFLMVFWLSINLVQWLKNSPELVDLVNLILPLLLVPLLTATYAEVNFEGSRLVKFVAPTEDRIGLLYYLQQSPLQLSIYGFTLSYKTIATAGLGILLALSSKVFLQELSNM